MNVRSWEYLLVLVGAIVLAGGCSAGSDASALEEHDEEAHAHDESSNVLELSPQARKNLDLVVKPLALATYWKTIQLPGRVIDRPGRTDRGVTAPIAGVVDAVRALPGDLVEPGQVLFSIRPSSEYVQNAQSELYLAARDVQLLSEQEQRLSPAVESGGVARSRLIEIEQEIVRKRATIEALRQDLKVRGLTPGQIERAERGEFVTSVDVAAPSSIDPLLSAGAMQASLPPEGEHMPARMFEVQELSVELGQQVAAGAILCVLADHESLLIEGHAFRQDSAALARAAAANWPITVEFSEASGSDWPPLEQVFRIDRIANAVDPESRTFAFFVPLVNQFQTYRKEGKVLALWRFRPGERVRLHVPVEEVKDVFVLPAAGVARDGPEAFVFRQNGDLFNRLPVHVLHENRLHAVVANDGSVRSGFYVAQNGAASLNRVLKSQQAIGMPVGVHVHADGTIHGAH
jgi:multidrug efflux pump subunit AcrA (membrane-fusion protein)